MLERNAIKYEEQKKFKWLKAQRLDFYLPEYNIAIECQGIQHFGPYGNFGNSELSDDYLYEKNLELDTRKNKLCKEHKVSIIYYAETNMVYQYPYCKNEKELLECIRFIIA